METIQRYFETFSIEFDITEKAIQLALDLIPHSDSKPSQSEIQNGLDKLKAKHSDNVSTYENLVDKLCDAIEAQSSMHWRHVNLALCMLTTLTRSDRPLPTRAVNMMVNNLIHDNLMVRRAQCRNVKIFLLLRFYVKSNLAIFGVSKTAILTFSTFSIVEFCLKIKIQS